MNDLLAPPPAPHHDSAAIQPYLAAFAASLDGMALYELDDQARLYLHTSNPAWRRLLGLAEQAPSVALDACLPAGAARQLEADSLACVAAGEVRDSEIELQLPHGCGQFLQRLVPLGYRQVLHILRDLTANRHHQQQLLNDTQSFRMLAEHTPDTIARYDRDCIRTYANPAFARLAEVPVEGLLGKKPSHVATAEMLAYEAKLLDVLHSGQPAEHELAWQTPDGRTVISHIRIVPERTADGQIVSVLAVGRDITGQRQAEEVLRIKEQEFRTLVENSPDVIVRFDRTGRRIYCNPAYEAMFGANAADVLGASLLQRSFYLPEQAARYHAGLLDVIAKGTPTALEIEWVKGNGEHVVQHVRVVPEFDRHGQVASVLTIARDISSLKETSRRLEEAEALARLGHWQLDFRTRKTRLSAELCRLLGQPRGWAPYPEQVMAMLPEEERNRIATSLQQAYLARTTELAMDYSIDTGQRTLHLHSRLRIAYAEDGTPLRMLGTVQDISKLKAYQKQLHTLAFFDSLTGLPNRELFNARLQQAMLQADHGGRHIAVMILDLDNFKIVNDTLGHAAGDDLLQEIARRLGDAMRDGDTVARLGGDEFALVLTGMHDVADLERTGHALLQSIGEVCRIQGRELFIYSSIGISRYPHDGQTIEELLQYADTALYHAKEQGRNNLQFYTPSLTQHTTQRLAIAANLRHARQNGELELYYQPQIDLSSGLLIGAEALLRWNHPRDGLIQPDHFISIAEETGLIVGIGEWVLHTACRTAVEWNRDRQRRIKVAVNLSPRQFKLNDLLASVCNALQTTGCRPAWLSLEITEGLLLDDNPVVRETLKQLSDMGFSIAIDDFGTGYSALGYLNRFPVETLKIDRSFIRDIEHNKRSAELVKAIISMAHSLRLTLIAEGVEKPSQEALLRRHGCHNAQGYFYGRPMSKAAFEQLLADL